MKRNPDIPAPLVLLPLLVLASLSLLPAAGVFAEELTMAPAEEVAEGGRLYDRWWAEYRLRPPGTTHPLYPADGKKQGADTWRCKECHGWDYKGKDGLYGKGSHYTGIKGIDAWAGRDPEAIVPILRDEPHGYGRVMFDGALMLIATFVSEGQIDMDEYIDRETKKVNGDAAVGKRLFEDICARCHGVDGRDMNFKAGSGDEEEYVGTVGQHNPWEGLHKIRNGQPGSRMWHKQFHSHPDLHRRHRQGLIAPGERMPYQLESLTVEEQIALLAYLQTLPAE